MHRFADPCKGVVKKPGFKPRPHQLETVRRCREMFEGSNEQWKGLLLYHGLGSGKTCSYSMVIDEYLSIWPDNLIYIITSGSLRQNLIQEYCGFCGQNTKKIPKQFIFLTYNYTGIKNKLPTAFTDCLIIIDEVHHILNAKVHDSTQMTAVYDKIYNRENSYVVAGSGSPLLSSYLELYYLWTMLSLTNLTLREYQDMFEINDGIVVPRNPQQLKVYLTGLIYYYESAEREVYPEVEVEYIDIPIHSDKVPVYIEVVREELKARPPDESLKASNPAMYKKLMTDFYLKYSHMGSRQLSNFEYPIVEYQGSEGTPKALDLPDLPIKDGGWLSRDVLIDLGEYSEKMKYILNEIQTKPVKHVVYTEFKTYHGSYVLGSLCRLAKIPFDFYDGDMNDKQRQEVLTRFNSLENLHGEDVRVLIITNAGAEGINLLAVQEFHVLEQSIRGYLIRQSIGRSVRYRSHMDLPLNERKVKVNHYMLDVSAYADVFYSSDYICYSKASEKEKNLEFLQAFIKDLDPSTTPSPRTRTGPTKGQTQRMPARPIPRHRRGAR